MSFGPIATVNETAFATHGGEVEAAERRNRETTGWLIERCGDVLAEIAHGRMLAAPKDAWRFVPVSDEYIGTETDRWLRGGFA